MKTPLGNHGSLKGGCMLVLTVAILVLPITQASYMANPTGNYLDRTTNHVMLYDNTTASLTDLGANPSLDECTNDPAAPPAQCGVCVYVPNDQTLGDKEGWKLQNPDSQFSYGYCANTDIDSTLGNSAWVRGNVRVVLQPGETWYVTFTTHYKRVGSSEPVKVHTPFPREDCKQDSKTAICAEGAHNWNPMSDKNAPPLGTVWNYYCIHTRVYNGPENDGPFRVAISCSGLVN